MASSGGGKLKSKRTRGAKKPYQRPKSILSHVTEAVTGVVPTWMKSMFTKNEEERDSEVVSEPASPDFDPDTPSTSYGTGYPPVHRTHAKVNEEDASHRSQHRKREEEEEAIQMGIPQRKHTPLPFIAYTQPIQTSTPVDNDFIQQPLRNLQTEERDDETDSSVSTSGCSSLLPHVDRADHKEKIAKSNLEQLSEWGQSSTSTPSRMSLWSDTNTLASQSHRGSRQVESKPQPAAKRPRFNASYFGTPRQNTTLTPDDRHQSSFYIGRTTFGGSSSYRSPAARKKYNPSPYQVHLPVKRHIRPKPAAQTRTDPDFGVTSNTAMKILNTLDRMSTPLSDAKRIPLTPTPSPFAYKPRRVAASERHKPVGGPPVSGLQIGEKAKVIPNTQPPLPKYPASSSRVSESATVVSTAPPLSTAHPSNSNPHWTPVASVAPASNNKPQKSTPVPPSSPPKSGGKMKTKSRNSLHYSASRDDEDEMLEVPDLPNIALPIGKKGLPSFNFGDPQSKPSPAVTPLSLFGSPANGGPKQKPASSLPPAYGQGGRSNFVEDTPAAPSKPNANPTSRVIPMMTSTPFSGNFAAPQLKFSTPQAKQEEEGSGINFTFSEPALKGSSFGKDALPTKAAEGEFTFSVPSQKVSSMGSGKDAAGLLFSKPVENEDQKVEEEEEEDSSGGIKVARSLKSGSCLQILGIGSSKPVTTSASPKKTQDTSNASSVFDKFKPAVGSWECDTCLVRNGKESLKCVACQADKPGAKTMSKGFSLAEKFKPAPGSWECGTCLIRNNAGVEKCIACSSSRPVSSENKTNEDTTVSLSEKFKPPKGSWECDTCLVRNKAEATNCVACTSERPGGVEKANSQQGSSNSNSLAEMFKPPERSWSCDTCLLQNQAKDTKCVACQSLKPGAKASQEQSQTKGFSIQGTEFKLSTPLSFGSKLKDNNESTAKASASVKPSLSEMFKPPEGSWECDTCLVRNTPASSRCVACETPKPGSEPALRAPPASSFKFGSSTSSESATSTQGFKIAGSIPSFLSSGTTLGNGGFKTDSGTTPTDNGNPSVGFKLPPGINFGSIGGTSNQLSGATSSDAVSSSGGFSLGNVRDKDTFSGGLSFGPSKDLGDSSKVADSSAPLNIGFKFGESNEDGKNKKSTTFTFGASSTTDETDKLSGTGAATLVGGPGMVEKKDQTVVKTAADATNQSSGLGFQFGAKPSEPSQSSIKATPNVNPFQSNLTSTGSKPAFSFGAPVSSESKPSASVANAVITNQSSSSSSLDTTTALPTFQFGSTLKSNQPLQQAVRLGKRKESEPSSTSVEKPAFNFAGSNPSGPSVKFGRPSASSGLPKPGLTFGASKTPGTGNPPTNASPFQFGAPPKSDVPPAQTSSPFAFGAKPQQSQVPVSNASGFQFGMVSSSSQNSQKPEKKPFTFGAVTTSSQSAAGSFTASKNFSGFDSAGTGPTKSAVPSFGGTASGFGSSALNNSASASLFGGQQNSTPVFGQSTLQQNSFGAPTNAVPSFGAGTSGGPAFGGSGPAFGSNSQPNANNTGFAVDAKGPAFQFGQNNNNNPSTGAFTFGANPTPPPSANTNQGGFKFNASQAPTFNFGAGAPPPASNPTAFQFSAAPTTEVNPFNASAPPSGRKIKKAVRRTNRKT